MANEITMTCRMTCVNGFENRRFEPGIVQIDQAAIGAIDGVVIVGTSEENMDVGDVSTPGRICLLNLDTTNIVQWGPSSGGAMVPIGDLRPGEPTAFRLYAGATLRWKAVGGSVKIARMLLEA